MRSAFFKKVLPGIVVLGAFSWAAQAQFTFNHIGGGATGSIITNDQASGSYTMEGGGNDIWDAADEFDYAHYTQTGNFDVKVRVESLEFTATWTKAGIMARETLNGDSRMAFNRVTPSAGANDTRYAYRTGLNNAGSNGGQHEDGSGNPNYPNAWLRLTRNGANIEAYRSTDGLNWFSQGVQNTTGWQGGAFANSFELGFAVSRHSGTEPLATAEFREFGNTRPSIITQPANTLVSTGQTASFSVGTGSGFDSGNVAFQWFEDGVAISGATSASYSKVNPLSGDNGRQYSVLVSNKLNALTTLSSNGVMSVIVNPQVLGAANRGNPVAVYVRFNQNMNAGTANTAGNYSIPGLVVSSAVLGADQRTVTLTTTAQQEGSNYVLSVSNVQNTDGNVLSPNPTAVNIQSLDAGVTKNSIVMKRFMGINGTLVSDLTSSPNFPNNPSDQSFRTLFEIPVDNADNYGAQVYGVFVAPVTGNYNFYISSDDEGKVYLSSDANPANKVQIATEPQWAGSREFVYPSGDCCGRPGNYRTNSSPGVPVNVASNISLVAGERRYLEMLVKEGGGGDNGAVAIEYPGTLAVSNGSLPIASSLFEPINRVKNGFTFTNYGPVIIVQNPTNLTVFENNPASFSVVVDGTPGYFIQWLSNGVAVPGASNLTYTFNAPFSANGAQYFAIISNDFSSATSTVATLTVLQAPQLLSAATRGDPNGVYLTFSRPMNATALNTANYLVGNSTGSVAISSATYFSAGSNIVRLAVTTLNFGGAYTARVSNVADTSGNNIFPNPSIASFVHGAGINAPQGLTLRRYDGSGDYNTVRNAINSCAASARTNVNLASFEYGTNPSINNSDGDTANYGAWVYGIFVPPTTGNYEFRFNSDDFGEFFLSTDSSPINKQLLVQQPSWGAARDFVAPSGGNNLPPPSPLVPLIAGQSYYMEFLFVEGGGGDHGSAAVRLPGGPAIVDGTANVLQRSMFSTNYSIGCPPTIFFKNLGPVVITSQPQSQTVAERFNATFRIALDGTAPYTIQWYSNSVPVANATGSVYTVRVLRDANGAQIQAIANNAFSSATSSVATLTVSNDLVAPTLYQAYGSGTYSNATLVFSEPVNAATALNLANYSITNDAGVPLAILSASQRDGSNIVFRTATQNPNERYTIVVNNVSDQALVPNVIAANSTISFRGWVWSPGFALMEVYPTGGGNTVANLTAHPSYPFYPRERYYITNATSRSAYPDDSHEAYGGRISGWFVPAGSSNFQFSIINDDDAALRGSLSEFPADAQNIGSQVCCSGTYRNVGGAIPLTQSNRYYFELLWKEGTGGDYAGVGFDGLNAFPPALIGSYANPDAVSLVITQQPTDVTKSDFQVATFRVGAVLTSLDNAVRPLLYQWRSNGVDIVGATGPAYQTAPVTAAAEGTVYNVLVRAPGATLLSSNAVLHYTPDTNGPNFKRIHEDGTLTRLYIAYDETVDPGPAGEGSNYRIYDAGNNQVAVLAVDYRGSNVVLTTDPLIAGGQYHMEIDFQLDLVGNPSVTDPLVTDFQAGFIAAPLAKFEAYLNYTGGSVDGLAGFAPYPNSPSFSFYTNVANWPQSSPDINNYAMRFTGIIVAPETGIYRFNPAHDDPVRLRIWNNKDGQQTGGFSELSAGCCTGLGDGPTLDVLMDAGDWRAYELVVVEIGGGDYAGIQMQVPSGATFSPANTNIAVVAVNAGIAVQPQDQTVEENHAAVFSVTVTNAGAGANYQWQSSTDMGMTWANISGANAASYNTGYVPLSASGTKYRVRATVPGRTLTSQAATLTVIADTNAPHAILARGTRTLNAIRVTFDEAMDLGSATEPSNYSVTDSNGAVVIGTPTLSADLKVVTIPTAPQPPGQTYTVAISGVTDVKGNAMISTSLTFRAWIWSRGFALEDLYFNIAGEDVPSLTNNPAYPNSPGLTAYVSLLEGPTDSYETYGTHLWGRLRPPVSGQYNLFMSSDDHGSLYLSTDANPANNVLVASEPGWNGSREFISGSNQGSRGNPPANRSTTLFPGGISLSSTGAYYVEVFGKEGGGGDNTSAAWEFPGSAPVANGSTPIQGAFMEALADPNNASVTITQQPQGVLFLGGNGVSLLTETFNSGNGGFTVTTPQSYQGPWSYNSGAGTWEETGHGNPDSGHPNTSYLDSPPLTVTVAGQAILTFVHRWSREQDTVNWDGNQVQVSVNGGAFTTVPGGSFTANGYNGVVGPGSTSALNGQPGFVGTSPNFTTSNVTSVAVLGNFTTGDVVRVRFVAASDGNTQGPFLPGWEINSVQVNQGGAQNVTFTVGARGTNEFNGGNPPFNYQWFRDDGAGFTPIFGANSASLTFVPTQADNETVFRADVYIPGASATSASATLIVGGPELTITRTATQTTITWHGPYCLQETSSLNGTPVWSASPVVNGVPFPTPTSGMKFYRLVSCP